MVIGIVYYTNPTFESFLNDESQVKWKLWDNLTFDYTRSTAVTMIVMGLLTFTIASCGFIGCSRRDQRTMKFVSPIVAVVVVSLLSLLLLLLLSLLLFCCCGCCSYHCCRCCCFVVAAVVVIIVVVVVVLLLRLL